MTHPCPDCSTPTRGLVCRRCREARSDRAMAEQTERLASRRTPEAVAASVRLGRELYAEHEESMR